MVLSVYEPDWTMETARSQYFEVNGFGADGGYNDVWADFKLGPIPFPFPNTKGRIRALQYHDMHHIVTGYDTTFAGELEISAWEIGAGCKDFWAAWFLNLAGLAGGLFSSPRRVLAAFVRGRRSHSLYGRDPAALLSQTVAELKAELRTDAPIPRATAGDVLRFGAWALVGTAVGLLFFGVGVLLAPVGVLTKLLLAPPTKPAPAKAGGTAPRSAGAAP